MAWKAVSHQRLQSQYRCAHPWWLDVTTRQAVRMRERFRLARGQARNRRRETGELKFVGDGRNEFSFIANRGRPRLAEIADLLTLYRTRMRRSSRLEPSRGPVSPR